MTVKHTPGPWFVCGVRQKVDGQEALGISRYDEEMKRDENIASVWYDPRDGAGTEDARLIAAAPDLLEAGIRVLNYATLDEIIADENRDNNDVFGIRLGDLRALYSAIAKATGK